MWNNKTGQPTRLPFIRAGRASRGEGRAPDFPGTLKLIVSCGLACFLFSLSFARACDPDPLQEESAVGDLTNQLLSEEPPEEESTSAGRTGVAADPLEQLSTTMGEIEARLRKGKVGPSTRQLQLAALSQLDELLAESSSDSEGEAGGGSDAGEDSGAAVTSVPANVNRRAPAVPATRFANPTLDAIWGHLPNVLQERIRNPLQEDFLPAYRSQIVDYYRKLAEQRSRP